MRLAWVAVVVVVAVLGCAGVAFAQSPPPSGPVSEPPPPPKTVFQSLKSFGSFGGNVGGMLFLSDEDASSDALVRPSLQTAFRYRFSEQWVGVSEFGFGWNAYKDKGDTVLTVMSGTVGLFRHLSDALGLDWKAGGGVGIYRWNYKIKGRSIRDPQTQLHRKGAGPGIFLGAEAEKRLSRHVTLIGTGQTHFLFTANEDDFPTAFGGNDSFVTARFGVNYHFSPYEGILWERKVKRTIRLESGRAGS